MFDLFLAEKPKLPKFGSLIAVIRNGKYNIIDSKFLVRGDIVEIDGCLRTSA
jgi:magnesium-transporting ATPase (P-type)